MAYEFQIQGLSGQILPQGLGIMPAQAWPKFPKKKVFGKKDIDFIMERRSHMEAYYNEIFSEKRTDLLTSRRVMGELFTYCRDVVQSDTDKQ
jgi:hypothetical protein